MVYVAENSYRFFSDGTRVPIAAQQCVHCVPVIARALRRIKAEGTHKERSQTRVALAQDWYTSAAPPPECGDVEHERRLRLSDRDLQVLDLKAAGALSCLANICATFPGSATTMDRECSGNTLGTLERRQRPVPVPVRSSDLLLVPDAPSAGCGDTVIWNVIRTHTRSRNKCNAKAVETRST